LKPGVQNTEDAADSGASTPAIRPWMWNRGMMFSPRSAGVKRQRAPRCSAPRRTGCAASSGTIFGREVVPEVCSTIDTSPRLRPAPGCAAAAAFARNARAQGEVAGAASRRGSRSDHAHAQACCATSMAGEVLSCSTTSSFALRSPR
jgi:hypothetical protein